MNPPAGGPRNLRQLCHDLSQPLTAARCSLELALRLPPDDPERAGFFDDAVAALERMAQLVTDVRELPGEDGG